MNPRLTLLAAILLSPFTSAAVERPNILWITSEDNGPELGCYGDAYATTPNIDALASRGTRFLNCWSTAPVCAPARTTLLTGLYPASLGAQHMRSSAAFPPSLKTYPEILRANGYYCINPGKTDYNFSGLGKNLWDKNIPVPQLAKKSATGTPFMAVYNYTVSHESQVRKRPHSPVHDPAGARVPPYHPDTPEVRRDWAQYYDKVTEMDAQVGAKLAEFEKAGLLENTIVFYYGDHGAGMPRSKRWPYNSGLHVPLIVQLPEKFRSLAPDDMRTVGGTTDRLVGFVDFAPTILSLAGLTPPSTMQGIPFMGPDDAGSQPYIYGFRGRMDERFDLIRTVRDQRFHYIRNYMPHRIYGQFIAYMFETPTTRVWHDRFQEGALNEAQSAFWKTKPAEELYDLETDPDEINNLASDPAHADTLTRLRSAQETHALSIRDLGFLPEGEMHTRGQPALTPYEMGQNGELYPMLRIHTTAAMASSLQQKYVPLLIDSLADTDSAVRYWGAAGLLMRGKEALTNPQVTAALRDSLSDDSPYVRAAVAEALGRYGSDEDAARAITTLIASSDPTKSGVYVALASLNAIDKIGSRAAQYNGAISALPTKSADTPASMSPYIPDLHRSIAE